MCVCVLCVCQVLWLLLVTHLCPFILSIFILSLALFLYHYVYVCVFVGSSGPPMLAFGSLHCLESAWITNDIGAEGGESESRGAVRKGLRHLLQCFDVLSLLE